MAKPRCLLVTSDFNKSLLVCFENIVKEFDKDSFFWLHFEYMLIKPPVRRVVPKSINRSIRTTRPRKKQVILFDMIFFVKYIVGKFLQVARKRDFPR